MNMIENFNKGFKTAFGLVLILCLILGVFPASVSAANDTWDPENGSYVISTAADLNAFRSSITSTNTYKGGIVTLANDIEVGETVWGSSPANGKFEGIFDGQGHTISGFDYQYSGLFYDLYGQIINLNVSFNVTVNNRSYGGFANNMYDGAAVINCSVSGTFESNTSIAGMAVMNHGSVTIKNCYSSASITSTGGGACGLMSSARTGAIIENCYVNGTLNGSTGNYPIANIYSGAECTISDCYYLESISAAVVEGVTAKSESALKDQTSYPITWDFTDVWQMDTTTGFPILRQTLAADQAAADPITAKIEALPQAAEITLDDEEAVAEARSVYDALTETQKSYVSESSLAVLEAAEVAINTLKAGSTFDPENKCYVISTAYDLNNFRSSISASNSYKGIIVTLGNDIDISTAPSQTWKTISSDAFEGVFDGKGYTIKEFNDGVNRALFYKVGETGQIINLNVEYNVESGANYGGIAFYVYGTINSCSVSGTINSSSHFGGLAYYVRDTGTVKNCYSNANITATGKEGAGIARRIYGTVENCYTTSAVSAATIKGIGDLYTDGAATNCFYIDTIAVTSSTNEAGLAIAAEDLKKQETYSGWDFENIWQIESDSYPTLRQTVAAAVEKTEIQVKAVVTVQDKTVPETDINTDYSEFLKADYDIALVAADGTDESQAVIDSCNAQLVLKDPESGIQNTLMFTGVEGECDFTNSLNSLLNQYELVYTEDENNILNFFSDEDRIGVYGEDYSVNKPKLIFNGNTSYSQDQKDTVIAATESRIQESLKHWLPSDVSGHDAVFGTDDASYGSWLIFTAARAGYTPYEGFLDECYQAFVEKYSNSGNVDSEGNPLNEGFDMNEVAKDALAVTAIGYDARDVAGYNLIEMLTNGQNPTDGYFARQAAAFAIDSYDYLPGTQKAYAIALAESVLASSSDTGSDPLIDMYIMGYQPLAAYYDPTVGTDDELYPVKRAMEEVFIPYFSRMQGYTGVFYSGINYNNPWSSAQVYIMLGMTDVDIFQEIYINNGFSMLDRLAGVTQSYSADQGQIARGYEAVVRAYRGENQIFDCTDVEGSTKPVNDLLIALNDNSSQEQIDAAKAAYDALSDAKKASISSENLAKIMPVSDDQAAADAVTAMITRLPQTITLDDEAAVAQARSAYDALDYFQQKLVSEETVALLVAAETAIFDLKPDSGTVTIDVERFTIGQGFFKEPVTMTYQKGDTVMDLLQDLVGQENIVGSSSNVSGIKGADLGTATIPDYITNDLKGPTTEEANEVGCKEADVLAAGDYDTFYGYVSGWMYLVNNELPSITANDYVVEDGDVIRWAFTVWAWGADIDGTGMGGFSADTADISNKDSLLKAMAAVNGEDKEVLLANEEVKTAYANGVAIISEATKTEAETKAAADALNQAIVNAGSGSGENSDQAAADIVTNLIAALPETLKAADKAEVMEVSQAYNKLSAAQKALVTNVSDLTTAKETMEALLNAQPPLTKEIGEGKSIEVVGLPEGVENLNFSDDTNKEEQAKVKEDAKKAAEEQGLKDVEVVTLYDIKPEMSDDDLATFNADDTLYVTITLPIPEGQEENANYVIYHLKEDGTVEWITPVLSEDGKYLIFKVSSFSEFGIVAGDKMTADEEAAQTVIDLIADLPVTASITLDNQGDVQAARSAYDALTANQQALVGNFDTLTAAEAKITELTTPQSDGGSGGGGTPVTPVDPNPGDDEPQPVKDEKTGIEAVGLPDGVGLIVGDLGQDQTSEEAAQKAAEDQGLNGAMVVALYDIKPDMSAEELEAFNNDPEAKVTLTMPIPEGKQGLENYMVYHLKESGEVEWLTPVVSEDGKTLIFEVSAFSTFGIVTENTEAEPGDQTGEIPVISYQTHVENVGWQEEVTDGALSGTQGRGLRLEGIKINVNTEADLGIAYQTQIENIGWQDERTGGDLSGTEGQGLRLEGIKIHLTGNDADKYDIYYRVHAQNFGWMDWAKNGQASGTEGFGDRLEAIEIRILEKDGRAPGETSMPFATNNIGLSYQTQIQNVGWQDEVSNGALSGTEGQGLRLEGIKIKMNNAGYDVGVSYQTQIENIGWQDQVSDGALSGTEGQSLRLEGIKINLTGQDAELCDIYYQVHAQNVGWMGWAKNGQAAGTEGFGYRLEGIRVVVVPKGQPAPGSTDTAFLSNN